MTPTDKIDQRVRISDYSPCVSKFIIIISLTILFLYLALNHIRMCIYGPNFTKLATESESDYPLCIINYDFEKMAAEASSDGIVPELLFRYLNKWSQS